MQIYTHLSHKRRWNSSLLFECFHKCSGTCAVAGWRWGWWRRPHLPLCLPLSSWPSPAAIALYLSPFSHRHDSAALVAHPSGLPGEDCQEWWLVWTSLEHKRHHSVYARFVCSLYFQNSRKLQFCSGSIRCKIIHLHKEGKSQKKQVKIQEFPKLEFKNY